MIEGYLRPMLAHNWDRGSLYSYRAFSFPSDMPYEAIQQPVMFITGEKDQPLTRGAKKVRHMSLCKDLSALIHMHDVVHEWCGQQCSYYTWINRGESRGTVVVTVVCLLVVRGLFGLVGRVVGQCHRVLCGHSYTGSVFRQCDEPLLCVVGSRSVAS